MTNDVGLGYLMLLSRMVFKCHELLGQIHENISQHWKFIWHFDSHRLQSREKLQEFCLFK